MSGIQLEQWTDRLFYILDTSPQSLPAVRQSYTPSLRQESDCRGLDPNDGDVITAALSQLNSSLNELRSDWDRLKSEDKDSARREFNKKDGAQRTEEFLKHWLDWDTQVVTTTIEAMGAETAAREARGAETAAREARGRVYKILRLLAGGWYDGSEEIYNAVKRSLVESGVVQVATCDINHVRTDCETCGVRLIFGCYG